MNKTLEDLIFEKKVYEANELEDTDTYRNIVKAIQILQAQLIASAVDKPFQSNQVFYEHNERLSN